MIIYVKFYSVRDVDCLEKYKRENGMLFSAPER